jgi:hypothetical protein
MGGPEAHGGAMPSVLSAREHGAPYNRTHVLEELCHDLASAFVRAQLAHAVGHQAFGVIDERAAFPLALVVARRALGAARERLDGREALDAVLGAQWLVNLGVTVDSVEGDQGGERRGCRSVLGNKVLAVSAPSSG